MMNRTGYPEKPITLNPVIKLVEDQDFDFQAVIDQLEHSPGITEEVYELENIKWVYSLRDYNRVMDAVYDEDYSRASQILGELEGENTE